MDNFEPRTNPTSHALYAKSIIDLGSGNSFRQFTKAHGMMRAKAAQ